MIEDKEEFFPDSRLRLIHSNRLELLVEQLADEWGSQRGDPMLPLPVLVQSGGMARWLSLRLAERLAIVAGLEFLYPGPLVDRLLSTVLPERPPDPGWNRPELTARIDGALAELLGGKDFADPARYVAGGGDPAGRQLRRMQLADRLADCFDQYIHYRPELISAWERGDMEAFSSRDCRWQGLLFCRVAAGLGDHRGRLYESFRRRLAVSDCEGLPPRLIVFGLSGLPPTWLGLLEALAWRRPVDVYLLNPSPEYWGDQVSRRRQDREEARAAARGREPEQLALESGLLGSLGTTGREFLDRLLDCNPAEINACYVDPGADSRLHRLQQWLFQCRSTGVGSGAGDGADGVFAPDPSLRLHLCHSPMREVELLHDLLLERFNADPHLVPGDVLVMAPDIGEYAPFIRAVFDSGPADAPTRLPFRISDRSLPEEHSWTAACLALLDILASRFPAGAVLRLLEHEPIRRRAGLEESHRERIARWIEAAGIRWGVDGGWKEGLGLPADDLASWREGMIRLLLGYACDTELCVEGRRPVSGVEGEDARILGRFLALIDEIFRQADVWSQAAVAGVWRRRLAELVASFLPDEADEGTQLFHSGLDRIWRALEANRPDEEYGLETVIWLINDSLKRSGFGHGFLTGAITCCSLQPMRAVPAKVLALLGMNLGDYPRQDPAPGFDLIRQNPRPGDRSRRDDDRYLFLECLLSARDVLHISCVALDPRRGGEPSPPSVVVTELEEELQLSAEPFLEDWCRSQPLHSFHPGRFLASACPPGHDACLARAAAALVHPDRVEPPFFPLPLSEPADEECNVDLEQLLRFFRHPGRYLLENVCGIRLPEEETGKPEDRELFQFDLLGRYTVDNRLLLGRQEGRSAEELRKELQGEGALPTGEFGRVLFSRRLRQIDGFLRQLQERNLQVQALEPRAWEWKGKGCRLRALLPRMAGGDYWFCRFGRIRAIDRLRTWLYGLAGQVAGEYRYAVLVGPEEGKPKILRYPPGENAAALLQQLLDIYRQGQSRPLPFFCEESHVYVVECGKGDGDPDRALRAAKRRYHEGDGSAHPRPPAAADPWNRLIWGGEFPAEGFAALAEAVWRPLLAVEEGQ